MNTEEYENVVCGDTGEIHFENILRAHACILVIQNGWTVLGEEHDEHGVDLMIRMYKEYEGYPNPWSSDKNSSSKDWWTHHTETSPSRSKSRTQQ